MGVLAEGDLPGQRVALVSFLLATRRPPRPRRRDTRVVVDVLNFFVDLVPTRRAGCTWLGKPERGHVDASCPRRWVLTSIERAGANLRVLDEAAAIRPKLAALSVGFTADQGRAEVRALRAPADCNQVGGSGIGRAIPSTLYAVRHRHGGAPFATECRAPSIGYRRESLTCSPAPLAIDSGTSTPSRSCMKWLRHRSRRVVRSGPRRSGYASYDRQEQYLPGAHVPWYPALGSLQEFARWLDTR